MTTGRPDPRVTIVIPAYNAEGTLAAQLDAMTRQDYTEPFEVVVSDNGSTDGTADVVERFAERLPGLRRVDASRRRGPAAARNVGAAAASGSLLLFCDADDVAADDWVRRMSEALALHEFVGGAWELQSLNPGLHLTQVTPGTLSYLAFMPTLPAHGGGNLGIRAALFEMVGGFDEQMRVGEDIDFCWRVQLEGCALVAVDDAVVSVRIRPALRDVWHQGWQYGRGERRLRLRYAEVGRRLARAGGLEDPAVRPRLLLRIRATMVKVRYIGSSVARPHERALGVAALAESLGRRLARGGPGGPFHRGETAQGRRTRT